MRLGRFLKSPGDVKRYTVDYVDWVDDDETVLTVQGTTPPNIGAFEVSAFGVNPDAKSVFFYVSGGIDGKEYPVMLTITTSKAQIKEDSVTFMVTIDGRAR